MTVGLPFTTLAASLPSSVPFVGPEAQERARGAPFAARLGANENGFGPSPLAVEAMRRAVADVWRYGDPEMAELVEALAAHHDVDLARIAVGEGIDGMLQVIVRLFAGPDQTVVTSAGAYPTFAYHVAGFGACLVRVPYADDHEDPPALVEAAEREGASLVYLANPDNPMGTAHAAPVVLAALDALPAHAILVLDEAYVEFAPGDVAPPLSLDHPRLIRLRTFSKAYGMAGARIGYAITSPEIARAFDKVRNHFGVNRIAQAGAIASLCDGEHVARTRQMVDAAKARIAAIATAHGLRPLPSATNFCALDTLGDGDTARALVAALGRRGVFVRMPFVAPQDRCIRVTAGPEADLDAFEAALGPALAEARAAGAAAE